MWCGAVGCATDHRKRGRTPSAPALLEIMEAGLHRQARSVKPYLQREFGDTLTLAEGIENEEQLKVLQKLGCQLGQGYYFARPLPEDEFWERYIKK